MNSDLQVSRGNSLMEAEVDGEMVGLHVESGICYGFNGTAYRIWQLVETPKSLTDLCEALSREFAVDLAACRAEVAPVLEDLARQGLVRLSNLG
jgi:hypothetical protein